MKALALLVVLFTVFSTTAQTDTIFVTNQLSFPCRITAVNKGLLHFTDSRNDSGSVNLNTIQRYSVNGLRIEAGAKAMLQLGQKPAKKDSIDISEEITYMRNCLQRSHQQFRTGLVTACFGLVVGSVGTSFRPQGDPVVFVGGAMFLIGSILMIDSHHWINKAGLGISPNGLGIRYRMK